MSGPFSRYVRPYRRRIGLGVACIALSQAGNALIPIHVGAAVDTLQATGVGGLHEVGVRVAIVLGLATLVAAGGFAMRRLLGVSSTRIEYDIRTAYFAHLLSQPLSFYQAHRTGDLMARATNDLNQVRIFFTYGLRGLGEAGLTFAFTVFMMCRIDWQLSLLVMLPLPLMSLFIVRMASLVHTRFRAIQDYFGDMSNFIQETLTGIRVVKAYVQGPAQTAAFDALNEEYLARNRRLIHTHAIYRPLSFLIASTGLGLNLWLGGRAVVAGALSIGDFVALNAYLTLLIRPVSSVGWVIDRSQRALVAMRRINEVLAIVPEIADRSDLPGGDRRSDDGPDEKRPQGPRGRVAGPSPAPGTRRPAPTVSGALEWRGVTVSHDGRPALRDVDLVVPAGTTLGVIGRVGAGKTTLARLIPRLIEPTAGTVLLDGMPLRDWPLSRLRGAIGYVSQNPFLFSDTVATNIGYGLDGDGSPASGEADRIRQAAEEAQVLQDVVSFEDGFDTVIGERGVTLSGGQRQRLTLARALLCRPRILILDDALSAVDTHTEEAILTHLRRIMAQRTTILIAHRISTLRAADRIVVLDDGRIAETGTHGELVRADGIYASLARRQALAAELECM